MDTRNFHGRDISLLGFGLMRLPTKSGPTDIDKVAAKKMVANAISAGINYFDTAYMYHGGESERFVGEALSGYARESFCLASKMPLVNVQSASDVETLFNEQLARCKTDYFDYYLLHSVQQSYLKTLAESRVYEQLLKKKETGQIKHLGFSFHDTPELLQKIVDEHDYDFGQIQVNYFDWELQRAGELHEILHSKKIPIHVMEPVRGGALAKLSTEAIDIFKVANPLTSPASWAMRYVASLPGVQVVLSGMSTMEQLIDNIKTYSPFIPLTESEKGVIEAATSAFRKASTIPCTNCRYCMDCPSGVEIPKNMDVYNNYERYLAEKNSMADFLFKMEYRLLKPEGQAVLCNSCGQCLDRCPQKIDIPSWMEKISHWQSDAGSA
ncbi:MAG: aldo/keto reductase [Holophagaceae bacterium]|nr:aldo/keto reductase [Holophagaceae bacterium]